MDTPQVADEAGHTTEQLEMAELELAALKFTYKVRHFEKYPLAKCPPNGMLIGPEPLPDLVRSLKDGQLQPILLAILPGQDWPFVIIGERRIKAARLIDARGNDRVNHWYIRANVIEAGITLEEARAWRSIDNNTGSANDLADAEYIAALRAEAQARGCQISDTALARRLGTNVGRVRRLAKLLIVKEKAAPLYEGALAGKIAVSTLYRVPALNGKMSAAVDRFAETGHLTTLDVDALRRVSRAEVAQRRAAQAVPLPQMPLPLKPQYIAWAGTTVLIVTDVLDQAERAALAAGGQWGRVMPV